MSKKERKEPPPLTRVSVQKPCRDDRISSPVKESDMSRHRQKPLQKFLTPQTLAAGMTLLAKIIDFINQHFR
jgi:hypothetical protein